MSLNDVIDINLIKKADLLHNQESKKDNEGSFRDAKQEAQDSFYEQEIKDKILSRSQRTDIFKWVVRVSSFYLSALFFIFMLNALEIKGVVNIRTIFLMFFSLISLVVIFVFINKNNDRPKLNDRFLETKFSAKKIINIAVLSFIALILFIIISLIFDFRSDDNRLSDSVMIALITSTTTTIIGLPVLIVTSLYKKEMGEKSK
jgi:phosphoglycerol transferase MdoB-like AlkP superfamily enzyme